MTDPDKSLHGRRDPPAPQGSPAIDALLILLLLAGSVSLYLVGLGSYALWDPWEPNYGAAMREMAARGDYMTPYLDGWIRWTKPILYYWAMLPGMKLWGNNELTVRLPSALAATAGVLVLFSALRDLRGRRTAMMAACILGTMPQYLFLARQGMPDMLMTFFLTAAMGFFALGRFGREYSSLYFHAFYLCAALALLTKGPVTCVIIIGAVGMFWLLEIDPERMRSIRMINQDLRAMITRYRVMSGLLLFFGVGAPWFVYMMVQDWDGFRAYFVMWENVQRFTEPIREHHGLANYYLRIFFHGMYPWSCLAPISLCFLFAGTARLDEEARQRWYFLCWVLSSFLLFSIAATKQPHYILPMAPPLAVVIALFWEDSFAEEPAFWVRPVFLVSILFLFLTINDFLVEGNRNLIGTFTNRHTIDLDGLDRVFYLVLAAWGVTALALAVGHSRVAATVAVLAALGQGLYFSQVVLPHQTPKYNMQAYLDRYEHAKSAESTLAVFGKYRYSITYYLPTEAVRRFWRDESEEMVQLMKERPRSSIITEDNYTRFLLGELNRGGSLRWRRVSKQNPSYDLISNDPALR